MLRSCYHYQDCAIDHGRHVSRHETRANRRCEGNRQMERTVPSLLTPFEFLFTRPTTAMLGLALLEGRPGWVFWIDLNAADGAFVCRHVSSLP